MKALLFIAVKIKEGIKNYHNQLSIAISLSLSIKLDYYKKNEFLSEYIDLAEKFRNARIIYVKTIQNYLLVNLLIMKILKIII